MGGHGHVALNSIWKMAPVLSPHRDKVRKLPIYRVNPIQETHGRLCDLVLTKCHRDTLVGLSLSLPSDK